MARWRTGLGRIAILAGLVMGSSFAVAAAGAGTAWAAPGPGHGHHGHHPHCHRHHHYPPGPAGIQLSRTSVPPGGSLVVTAEGFCPHVVVNVDIHSADAHLATVHSDSAGDISVQVTVPDNIKPGSHEIVAKGQGPDGLLVLEAQLTVTSTAPVAAVSPRAAPTSLPMTGADIGAMAAVGALLIIGGSALLLGRHRASGHRA
jgi:LPXTG-motif cell wall-anchored protein